MPLILPGNVGSATAATGYNVANSVRFNGDAYVHKAVVAGNQRTFTYSFWTKRSTLNNYDTFIGYAGTAGGGGSTARGELIFVGDGDDTLRVGFNPSASSWSNYTVSDRVFRDPSAWYHIVLKVNTTSGTEAERLKIFVNGVSQGLSGYPSQNFDTGFNVNGYVYHIGRSASGTGNFIKGYLTEAVFIDGTALDADSFGEFDSDSGIWKPIDVSGLTFGNNGFHLDFEASGNLGNDANGGTDFTEVSLAATDQTTDTCTNNFATLNAIGNVYGHTYSGTFSNGNLSYATSGRESIAFGTMETVSSSSNGFYFEIKCGTLDSNRTYIGLIDPSYSSTNSNGGLQNFNEKAVINSSGEYFNTANGTSVVATYTSFSANDIIMVAYKNGSIWFGKNGTWMNSGNPSTAANAIDTNINTDRTWLPSIGYNSAFDANFGSPPFAISSGNTDGNGYGNFEYAVPSSYYSLNTKNLAKYG